MVVAAPPFVFLCALLVAASAAAQQPAPPRALTPFEAELSRASSPGTNPRVAQLPSGEEVVEPAETDATTLPSGEEPLPPLAEFERRLADLEREVRGSSARGLQPTGERPSSRFTMQLQADFYDTSQDAANLATVGPIPDGSAFRRARVGWMGEHEVTEYRIEVDFALPGRPSFLDVWAGLVGLPVINRLRVGHFFEPFSLERMTTNRFTTFMERALPDQPFAPARNLGVMTMNNTPDERMTWALGLFASNSDPFGNDTGVRGDGAVTGRVTWLPWYDEPSGGRYYAHLGMAGSYRRQDNDTARFQAQPEARIGAASPNIPFFVDTGNIPARSSRLAGFEAAWVHGPFSLQSEYMVDTVDRLDGPNPTFDGWYVVGSYFLTGEHRPYRRKMPSGGTFDRVVPFENFFLVPTRAGVASGWGAWEIAFRVSQLDFNDAGIEGGRLTDLTAGLNWYLTPYLRVTANYVHAMLADPVAGRSNADIYAMRVGYEF